MYTGVVGMTGAPEIVGEAPGRPVEYIATVRSEVASLVISLRGLWYQQAHSRLVRPVSPHATNAWRGLETACGVRPLLTISDRRTVRSIHTYGITYPPGPVARAVCGSPGRIASVTTGAAGAADADGAWATAPDRRERRRVVVAKTAMMEGLVEVEG